MLYIPSPTPLKYQMVFTATANPSGRMQYHRIIPGKSKKRISRTEFISEFNARPILAVKPLQEKDCDTLIQMEFYI